jgi:hypothetical protein
MHVGIDGTWPETGQRMQWTGKQKWAWGSKQRTEKQHGGEPYKLYLMVDQPSDKTGRDHRGKGRLQYVGGRYLRFAETGEYFLKQGADAPGNLFAYEDFDGDFKNDGQNDKGIKSFGPHVRDWKPGDPTWSSGKGKGLIGAINYLASEGMNAFSFLPLNIDGDDKNVFPYLNYDERYRMDVSRLDQWEVVFEHADRLGMFIHFKTLETENELLLDGGDLGPQRKLYYRELIARFGHHLALNWNLGKAETTSGSARKTVRNRPGHTPCENPSGKVVDDRVQVCPAAIEQPDQRRVDMPDLVRT